MFGPVNGGLKSPKNFKEVFKNEVIFDFLRNFIYKGLTKLPVWNKYYKNASTIINSDQNVLKIVPKKFHHKTFQIFDTLANTDIFMPNPQKLDTPKTIVLLFCGRLIAKKGVLLLLESYKRCLETHKIDNLLLNIAGNGQLYQQIIDFIKTNNLEGKVNVYSKLSRESVVEKYKEAHIFCAPTLREPGGTAILEAMACSLPIITSNYGGPSFSVTDECGIKINMVDYQTYTNDLTDAILYLYNNPEVRNEMGSKGRERAIKEFSLQSVEQKLTKIWKTL